MRGHSLPIRFVLALDDAEKPMQKPKKNLSKKLLEN
jgi:hypothetical protein